MVLPVMVPTGAKDRGLVKDVIVTLMGVLAGTIVKPFSKVRGTTIV